MDNATLSALVKSFGAPDTPDNVNRVREFYAADPTAAERRLYGVKGQSDESGGSRDALLNSMLDKFVQQTSAAPVALPVSPDVQAASGPTRRSATAGASAPSPAAQTREQYGPGGSDPLAREVNRATAREPRAIASAPTGSGYEVDPQVSATDPGMPNGDNWMLDLIAPIIGMVGAGAVAGRGAVSAAGSAIKNSLPNVFKGPEAKYVGPMNTEVGQPDSKVTKQDRIGEGQRAIEGDATGILDSGSARRAIEQTIPLDNRSPSQVTGSKENEDKARKAQTQAEIDAANKEGNAVQKEILARQKKGQWNPIGARRVAPRK